MFICLQSLREETKLYVHVVKAQLIASKAKYSPKEKKGELLPLTSWNDLRTTSERKLMVTDKKTSASF